MKVSLSHYVYKYADELSDNSYSWKPHIGDIIYCNGDDTCISIIDKINKLTNGHVLIHLVAGGPGAYTGWFNMDKITICIKIIPKLTRILSSGRL